MLLSRRKAVFIFVDRYFLHELFTDYYQTWPVPDVTRVLQDAIEEEAKISLKLKVDSRKEIENLKDLGRYVLEVY